MIMNEYDNSNSILGARVSYLVEYDTHEVEWFELELPCAVIGCENVTHGGALRKTDGYGVTRTAPVCSRHSAAISQV